MRVGRSGTTEPTRWATWAGATPALPAAAGPPGGGEGAAAGAPPAPRRAAGPPAEGEEAATVGAASPTAQPVALATPRRAASANEALSVPRRSTHAPR